MEIIKDFLTLFLQLTAVQALLVASWPIRKPKLKLATAIFVLNLDLALRSKTYSNLSDCKCLSDFINSVTKETDGNHDRVIFGYHSPFRGFDVIKELSEWESTQYSHGPALILNEKDKRHWPSILRSLKYQLGIDTDNKYRSEIAPEFRRGPLDRLHAVIKRKYGYELGNTLDSAEESTQPRRYIYCEDEQDLLAKILADVEKACPNDMERAIAISRLQDAYKAINIVQLKNPYHASINNIHLLISNAYRGKMKLVTEFAEKQGFSITNSAMQEAHLILGELPPNSERYCILETRLRPLTEKDIKMQSNLLLDKLSPQIMRAIIIRAAIFTLLVFLYKYVDIEAVNNLELLLQNLLSAKS